jgi:hypothetical protein
MNNENKKQHYNNSQSVGVGLWTAAILPLLRRRRRTSTRMMIRRSTTAPARPAATGMIGKSLELLAELLDLSTVAGFVGVGEVIDVDVPGSGVCAAVVVLVVIDVVVVGRVGVTEGRMMTVLVVVSVVVTFVVVVVVVVIVVDVVVVVVVVEVVVVVVVEQCWSGVQTLQLLRLLFQLHPWFTQEAWLNTWLQGTTVSVYGCMRMGGFG